MRAGTLTSAVLALRLYLGREFEHRVVPFDRILDVVAEGGADAGLVIHEGQLTYGRQGVHPIVDLGAGPGAIRRPPRRGVPLGVAHAPEPP